MINYIEQNKLNGRNLYPSWNPRACKFFKKFDIENNTNGQYATNDKEFYIKKLGYWVDYINKDLKLIMEYDEKKHYLANGILKKKDVLRQKEIEKLFSEYKFIRIKEDIDF